MKFLSFLILGTFTANAAVPEICHEFAKKPETFKVSEKPKDCTYEMNDGTCRTEFLSCRGSYLNSKSDGAYFGYDEVAVEHKGKLYNFLSTQRKDLNQAKVIGEISEKGTTILCDIRQKVTKISLTNPESSVCKALYEGKVTKLKLLDSSVPFDLQGNASKVSYSDSGYASGAGCGCDLESYTAKAIDPKNEDYIKAFNKLDSNEPSCTGATLPLKWSVVRYEKKDYLYLENPGIKEGSLTDGYKKLQPEALYAWDGERFNKVCGKSYTTERVAVEPMLD